MIALRAATTPGSSVWTGSRARAKNELDLGREFDARRQAQPVFLQMVHRAVLLDGVELLAFLRPVGGANHAAAALVTVDHVPQRKLLHLTSRLSSGQFLRPRRDCGRQIVNDLLTIPVCLC